VLTDLRRGLPAGGRRVGLLGGSFNPAHAGHLHVSRLAIARLGLDAVWWLVSPQNPLKGEDGMAPLGARMADARRVARDPRIVVSDIEARTGTTYTADTLRLMARAFPRRRFVWLMGADNLVQLPQWRAWRSIPHLVPIAIFDRAPYSTGALAGMAARTFARSRRAARDAATLVDRNPPAWIFFHTPLHEASATRLRAERSSARRPAKVTR